MNNKKYSLIKGRKTVREGNTWYFYYEIIDNNSKKVIEEIKSWYMTRPLTVEENEKYLSSHLSAGIITEWEQNSLAKANIKLKILNNEHTR